MNARTALVVDDSKSARFALRKHLEGHAFHVDTVESAPEAYQVLADKHPDLIFLDHIMPGVDGFEALRHLKGNPRTASIPVIICSSNEGDAFVTEARSQGASGVLQKPPSPDQLMRVIDTVQRLHEEALAEAARQAEAESQAARAAEEAEAEARAKAAAAARLEEPRKGKAATAELAVQVADLKTSIEQLAASLSAQTEALLAMERRQQEFEHRLERELASLREKLAEDMAEASRRVVGRLGDALRRAMEQS